MFVPPYETRVCSHYKTRPLVSAINRVQIQHPLSPLYTPRGLRVKNASAVLGTDGHQDIPAFTQPLDISTGVEPHWVMDIRPFTRPVEPGASYRPYNSTVELPYRFTSERDQYFHCVRIALQSVLSQDTSGVTATRLGTLPAKTFVRWIVGTLSGRMNLPMDIQVRLSIIVAHYYYQRFAQDTPNDLLAQYVASVTGAPRDTVLDIQGLMEDSEGIVTVSIAGLLNSINKHSGSVRLEQLKFPDFYTLLMNSWSGVMAREHVGVALESMPTFLAMCFTAGTDRSYRKSIIARTFESAGRPTEIKAFTDRIQSLTASEFIEE